MHGAASGNLKIVRMLMQVRQEMLRERSRERSSERVREMKVYFVCAQRVENRQQFSADQRFKYCITLKHPHKDHTSEPMIHTMPSLARSQL